MKYLLTLFLAFSAAVAWGDGTVPLGEFYYAEFNTVQPSTGAPYAITNTPVIEVYEEGGATQITAGTTIAQLDSITGLYTVSVDTSQAGYEAGKWYSAVIAATNSPAVDSVSIVGRVVARFRVVAAETAAGVPKSDMAYIEGTDASDFMLTLQEIVDGILDEATSGHATAGTVGKALIDVLADTNELQGDWANNGRLDLILDTTLKYNVEYFDTTANGDIGRTFNTVDPTSGSDPTVTP